MAWPIGYPKPTGLTSLDFPTLNVGSDADYALPNERPAHRVKVSPFYLDINPVTNQEFVRFVEATGSSHVGFRCAKSAP